MPSYAENYAVVPVHSDHGVNSTPRDNNLVRYRPVEMHTVDVAASQMCMRLHSLDLLHDHGVFIRPRSWGETPSGPHNVPSGKRVDTKTTKDLQFYEGLQGPERMINRLIYNYNCERTDVVSRIFAIEVERFFEGHRRIGDEAWNPRVVLRCGVGLKQRHRRKA